MKHVLMTLFLMTSIGLLFGSITYAQVNNMGFASQYRTKVGFGGRVISLSVPTVTCTNPDGTAPVVLSANLEGIASAASSAFDKSQNTVSKTVNVASGLYHAIPLYTQQNASLNGRAQPQPKIGDWILGLQRLTPDLSTCQTDLGIIVLPFPVAPTDFYGVSRPTFSNQ